MYLNLTRATARRRRVVVACIRVPHSATCMSHYIVVNASREMSKCDVSIVLLGISYYLVAGTTDPRLVLLDLCRRCSNLNCAINPTRYCTQCTHRCNMADMLYIIVAVENKPLRVAG